MHILVAEDDRVSAMLYERTLRRDGHTVTVVSDGQAALSAARHTPFDLVVTDWLMPRKDGLEFVTELKRGEKPPPVLVVTALGSEQARAFALEAGADAYLPKPCSPDALAAEVRQLAARTQRSTAQSDEPVTSSRNSHVYVRESLFEEFRPLVNRLIGQYGATADGRRELEGEIYCLFFRLLQEFDPRRGVPFKAYVIRNLPTQVYSQMRSRWRRESREFPMDPEQEDGVPDQRDPYSEIDLGLDGEQVRTQIRHAIELLPERQRKIVEGRYLQGREFEDIAVELGLKASSVRSLLRTGLNTIRNRVAYLASEV